MEILLIAVLIGLLPAWIASGKGHSFFGFWLFGALLFIVALPVALLIKPDVAVQDRRAMANGDSKRCPHCSEMIRVDANACRHCGRDVPSRFAAIAEVEKASSAAAPIFMRGDGRYAFDIVGESRTQSVLDSLAGGKTEGGVDVDLEVDLMPDDDNMHDVNAVKVTVGGQLIGYLARDRAVSFRQRMTSLGLHGRIVRCDGKICGGWTESGGFEGHYGVKLDLVWPMKPMV